MNCGLLTESINEKQSAESLQEKKENAIVLIEVLEGWNKYAPNFEIERPLANEDHKEFKSQKPTKTNSQKNAKTPTFSNKGSSNMNSSKKVDLGKKLPNFAKKSASEIEKELSLFDMVMSTKFNKKGISKYYLLMLYTNLADNPSPTGSSLKVKAAQSTDYIDLVQLHASLEGDSNSKKSSLPNFGQADKKQEDLNAKIMDFKKPFSGADDTPDIKLKKGRKDEPLQDDEPVKSEDVSARSREFGSFNSKLNESSYLKQSLGNGIPKVLNSSKEFGNSYDVYYKNVINLPNSVISLKLISNRSRTEDFCALKIKLVLMMIMIQ